MKTLKVMDGKVKLHGEEIEVNKSDGLFLAVNSQLFKWSFFNKVVQSKSKFCRYQVEVKQSLIWASESEQKIAGELIAITPEQCKTESYKLEF